MSDFDIILDEEFKAPATSSIEKTIETHKMVRKNDVVSITITASIPLQHFYDQSIKSSRIQPYSQRKENFIKEWRTIFKGWYLDNSLIEYKFWLEISKSGLLHWHGYGKVNDPEKFNHTLGYYKYVQKKVNIDVDTIDDIEKWISYCSKDNSIMKTIIDSIEDNKPIKSKSSQNHSSIHFSNN